MTSKIQNNNSAPKAEIETPEFADSSLVITPSVDISPTTDDLDELLVSEISEAKFEKEDYKAITKQLARDSKATKDAVRNNQKILETIKEVIVPDDIDPKIKGLNDKRPTDKVTVYIRCAFLKLANIDTIKQNFEADAYVEARWEDPRAARLCQKSTGEDGSYELTEKEVAKIWKPQLNFTNILSLISSPGKERTWYTAIESPEGRVPNIRMHRRLKAIFFEPLELKQFPLDIQEMSIHLRCEQPAHQVNILPDPTESSTLDAKMCEAGMWSMYEHIEVICRHVNIEATRNPVQRSTVQITIRVARKFWYFLWNVALIIFMLAMMSFAVYTVSVKESKGRIGLNLTLILTTVAFKMALNTHLPKIDYLTYLDYYVLSGLVFLFMQVMENSIVAVIARSDPDWTPEEQKEAERIAWRVDRGAMIFFLVSTVVYHLIFGRYIWQKAFSERRSTQRKDDEYKKNPFLLCMEPNGSSTPAPKQGSPDEIQTIVNTNASEDGEPQERKNLLEETA